MHMSLWLKSDHKPVGPHSLPPFLFFFLSLFSSLFPSLQEQAHLGCYLWISKDNLRVHILIGKLQ